MSIAPSLVRSPRAAWPFAKLALSAKWWLLAGLTVYAVSTLPWLWWYIIRRPEEILMVDLDVYRHGALSLLEGRSVYDWLTAGPQWLPFTYPPFAALLGLPFAVIPLKAAAWAWTVMQLWLNWISVGIAFRPFLERFDVRSGLVHGVIAAGITQMMPISEGLKFGQVNSVIVVLCLIDLSRERVKWWARGSLVAMATAIKLTPGVFMIHWALARKWRVLTTAVVATALITGLSALLVPSAGAAYWFEAVRDPNRLGPNNSVANQSVRALLMRMMIPEGPWLVAAWVVLAAVVATLGFWVSVRFEHLGERTAVVAVCGLVAFLISPVSWSHHLQWAIVVLGVILGDGRDRKRIKWAVIGMLWLWFRAPVWGNQILGPGHNPLTDLLRVVFQNFYVIWAMAALFILYKYVLVRPVPEAEAPKVADATEPSVTTSEVTAVGTKG